MNRLQLLNSKFERGAGNKWKGQYRCFCGKKFTALNRNINYGSTRSCGCLYSTSKIIHGMYKSKEYVSWDAMKQRCLNPKVIHYKYYGGRGIKICKKWLRSFEAFYKDMGSRPKGMSLDRIDPDKGYYKENCRWATAKEQNNNKRIHKKEHQK